MSSDATLRRCTVLGVLVALAFFGVFGAWAVVTPLASTVIAPGEIGFDVERRGVEHPEGGIVAEILVADGDVVKAGDVLLRLDRTRAAADFEEARARHYALLATEARLDAERDGAGTIAFPPLPDDAALAAKAEAIRQGEERLFLGRRQDLEEQKAIIGRRIRQLEEEITALRDGIGSQDRQIGLLREESASLQSLFERGLVGKLQVQALQREIAGIEGLRSRARAAIVRAEQGISEQQLRRIELETGRNDEVLEQLRVIQTDILELSGRVAAAGDALRRTVIRAPRGGTVIDLAVGTIGEPIAARQPVLAIVPVDETGEPVVRARLSPRDIDVVRARQTAFVRLNTLSLRNSPPIEGRVVSVSADHLVDEATGLAYFLARVALPGLQSPAYAGGELFPGMPAEVLIQVGERSPLDYLLQPLRESRSRRRD